MRRARVTNHGQFAGVLEEIPGGFQFQYAPGYLATDAGPVSLTLPKRSEAYVAPVLFPFFAGLLAEGSTRAAQVRGLRLDEADAFGLLVATGADPVGSVGVEPMP